MGEFGFRRKSANGQITYSQNHNVTIQFLSPVSTTVLTGDANSNFVCLSARQSVRLSVCHAQNGF